MRFAVSIIGRTKHDNGDTTLHHNLTVRDAPDEAMAKEAAKLAFFRGEGRKLAKVMSVIAEPIEW